MAIVTNFNDLSYRHRCALVGGAKSGAWIEFAVTMMDSFPALYQTAQGMNDRMASLEKALRDFVAQVELHTDCMDGRIDRAMLDEQMDAAETLVGTWPDFKPDFSTTPAKGEKQ